MLHLAALDTTNAQQQASSLILDGCFWSLPSSFFSPANLTGPHAPPPAAIPGFAQQPTVVDSDSIGRADPVRLRGRALDEALRAIHDSTYVRCCSAHVCETQHGSW
ncbi:hypothetical protein FALCPG4_003938 [Fusarium falciforme]